MSKALEPFCVEHSKFFESPYGGRRAEGRSHMLSTTACVFCFSCLVAVARSPSLYNHNNGNSHSIILRNLSQSKVDQAWEAMLTNLVYPGDGYHNTDGRGLEHCRLFTRHTTAKAGDGLHNDKTPSRRVQSSPRINLQVTIAALANDWQTPANICEETSVTTTPTRGL